MNRRRKDNERTTESASEISSPAPAPATKRFRDPIIRDDAVYTVSEVATILQVTDKTVRAILKRGEMQARKIGQEWRVLGESLKDYMRSAAVFTGEDVKE